jgi:hypothetical protein
MFPINNSRNSQRDALLGDPHLSNIYTQYKERPSLLKEARLSWANTNTGREPERKQTTGLRRFIQKMLPSSLIT